MKVLLDTHTFIWWDSETNKLSPLAVRVCTDPANTLVLSVASIWEIQIKHQLGKLALRLPLADIVSAQERTNDLRLLSIEPAHVLAISGLPAVHKDPFDRILAAQAIVEGLPLLTADPIFGSYPVNAIW